MGEEARIRRMRGVYFRMNMLGRRVSERKGLREGRGGDLGRETVGVSDYYCC